MREMRDRAAILYVTVGPSPLGIPLDGGAPRYVPTAPKALASRRPVGKPIRQIASIDRYREAFKPIPARPAPTTSMGRFLRRIEDKLAAWL